MKHLFVLLVVLLCARTLEAQCNGYVQNTLGDANAYSVSSVIDNDDNIYTVGYFSGTMTVGTAVLKPSIRPVGIFLTKIDKNGQLVFTKLIAETNGVDVQSPNIAVGSNEIMIEGVARDSLVVGNTTYTKQSFSSVFYVIKLTKDAALIWSKGYYFNDPLRTGAFGGIVSDRNGGAFVTTTFRDTLDIGIKQLINKNLPILVMHIDDKGNITWAKMSGLVGGYAKRIALDGAGNVLLAGELDGGIQFDDKSTGDGTVTNIFRLFVASFGNDGSTHWLWAAQPNAGATASSRKTILNDLKCDKMDNIYLTGFMGDSVQFDNVKVVGRSSMYVAKLNPSGSIIWAQKKSGQVSGRPELGFMAIDSNQNIYFAGTFVDSTYFGTQKYTGIKGGSWFLAHFIDSSHWDHVTIGQNTGTAYPQSVMSTSRDSITVVISFQGNSTSFKGMAATNGTDTNSGVYNLAWFGACTLGNSVEENLSFEKGFTIFPNPATNKLHIKFGNSFRGEIKYEILNELGNGLADGKILSVNGETDILLDKKMIKSGIYFLKIQIGEHIFSQKFVVK